MLLIIAATLIGLVAAVFYLLLPRKGKRKPLPPYNSASLYENCTSGSRQKNLYIHQRNRRLFAEIENGKFGSTPFGAVFQVRVPFMTRLFLTSDYVLAKKFLQGDSEEGIVEGEKSFFRSALNLLDRKEYSILTHMTANEDRERARKSIAQSFSTSNLMKTWPHIKGVIEEQFDAFRSAAKSREIVDMRNTIQLFFMRTLSRGAFGIEFTDDGTETDETINGLEYLKAIETATRESFRKTATPFREYMFWAEGAIANRAAVITLRKITEKLIRLHKEKTAQALAAGEETKPFSILDHVAQHAYPREISRMSDVSILTLASIDTTAFTFCFLLMELCKNPHVKLKLQAELDTFMPARGACVGGSTASASPVNEKELLSAIARAEFLNMCIKEILRLWPAVATGPSRQLTQEIEYRDMLIPKGCVIVASLFTMFRERWIDQPDVYLPERWSDSNPQLPQLKEMFVPFSVGRRSCVGQNMAMFQLRIVAAHFLHYFDFELAAEVTFEHFVTLKPDQLLMRVAQRLP